MVIVNKSFEQMLEDIELERCTYYGFYDGGFYYPGRDGGFDYCKYLERKGFPLHAFELSIENVILHGKLPASIKSSKGEMERW